MFLISKLSPESQQFITQIAVSNKTRSAGFSVAVAKVLVDSVNMPSSELEDPSIYYLSQVKLGLEQSISTINELIIIDTKAVIDICEQFFNFRYRSANPVKNVYCLNKETCLEDFFGLSRCFENVTLHTIKNEGSAMVVYMNGLKRLVADLKG